MESVLHNCMKSDTGVTGLFLFLKSMYLRSGPASSDPNALKKPHFQAFSQITAFENYSYICFRQSRRNITGKNVHITYFSFLK